MDETEEQFLASLAKDENGVHFGCESQNSSANRKLGIPQCRSLQYI